MYNFFGIPVNWNATFAFEKMVSTKSFRVCPRDVCYVWLGRVPWRPQQMSTSCKSWADSCCCLKTMLTRLLSCTWRESHRQIVVHAISF